MRSFCLVTLTLSLPLVLLLTPSGAAPVERTIAYRGARILTAAGAAIDNGVLIVRKGKIVAVGAEADTPSPKAPKSST